MAHPLKPFVAGLAAGIPGIAVDFMFNWYLLQDYHIDTVAEAYQ